METHKVPLLVPHGIVKQLIYWAVPALPKGRSLAATFLVLLLCPQHLHTDKKRTHIFTLFLNEALVAGGEQDKMKVAPHPIILGQSSGDVIGTSFLSARMIAVFEQEMVLQGPNLRRGRHKTG